MAITARIIRYLISADYDSEALIHVAEAMERGDDAYRVFRLIQEMSDQRASDIEIGTAVVDCADAIKEAWLEYSGYRAPVAPDAYRERRGVSDNDWRKIRAKVFERDGHSCCYCYADEDLCCDHIVPLIQGGSNDLDNLAVACRSCNSSKGGKTLEQWRANQWA